MITHEAIATYDNGHTISIELQGYQVDDFVFAVYNKLIYKDEKTGVMSWLPPDRLCHLVIKPNLESPKCQNNQSSDLVSDLLT